MPTKLPPLRELRRQHVLEGRPLPREIELVLKADARPGARALLGAIERRRGAKRAEGQRLRHMCRFEQPLWESGLTKVAGVDEAGMSPLAGPVVAAAVILPVGCKLEGVDDSKKLDERTREALAPLIKETAVDWAVGVVSSDEIDQINIYRAGLLAMRRAVTGLREQPEHLLIDARRLRDLFIPQEAIVKGDARSLSIAAASILAKTARDALMREFDARFPGYGFAKHKGYGVRAHLQAMARLGVLPIHRRSFGPVRKALGFEPEQLGLQALTQVSAPTP